MFASVEEVVSIIERILASRYEEVKKRIIEKQIKLGNRSRKELYVCEDNKKVYASKPKKCSSYKIVQADEYVESEAKRAVEYLMVQVKGWKWIAENCGDILNTIADAFFENSKMFFFKGGYMHVLGITEPQIIVVLSRRTPYTEELVRRMLKCPYKVSIYVGKELASYPPEVALAKLLELPIEQTQ